MILFLLLGVLGLLLTSVGILPFWLFLCIIFFGILGLGIASAK